MAPAQRLSLDPPRQWLPSQRRGRNRERDDTGAVEIALAVLADSLDVLDPKLPVVAYCADGYRSAAACGRGTGFGRPGGLLVESAQRGFQPAGGDSVVAGPVSIERRRLQCGQVSARRRYSKRTLPGLVMRRSSGSVTVMMPQALTRPIPIRA
jgi:hypothetical protein